MMFKRILIAEDHESANISVQKTLADLGLTRIQYSYYCDDALMLLKKSLQEQQPFDLLITDLSFEEDHRIQTITGGMALITAAKQLQPYLKVLVFSAESNANVIDKLFKDLDVDAYVRKARHDAKDLKAALAAIADNKIYLSSDIRQIVKQKNAYEFSNFDITIITQLSQGTLQKDIPDYLQQNDIKPSGLSSVEKRLNLMKEALGFSKNEQLVAHCKDFGII